MKTNFMNKAFALLTSVLTASAMTASVSVFAVDSPTIDAPPAHVLQDSSVIAEIPIKKDIVLFNSSQKYIHEPNIVYSYEITSANVTNAFISTKIDSNSSTATTEPNGDNTPDANDAVTAILAVRPGVMGAITNIKDSGDDTSAMAGTNTAKTGTITFGNSHNLNATNTTSSSPDMYIYTQYKVTNQMNLQVDASKIYDTDNDGKQNNGPGVYRYMISDVTADATYAASGVMEGAAGDSVFLDVYTKYNEGKNNLVVYGYVLLKSTEDGANTSITYNKEAKEGVKIEGFVTTSEGDDNGDGKVLPGDFKGDRYDTFNVLIKKQVAGDLADRHHEFPFEIQLSNSTVTNSIFFSVNDGSTHAQTRLTDTGTWDNTTLAANQIVELMGSDNNPMPTINDVDFKLKHDDRIFLIGLPRGTKVNVIETNDTANNYSVSASFNEVARQVKNGEQIGTSLVIPSGGKVTMIESNLINTYAKDDELVITNMLRDVSVTGLLFDTAPFLFITSAGIFLFTLYLRNKKETDADNMI